MSSEDCSHTAQPIGYLPAAARPFYSAAVYRNDPYNRSGRVYEDDVTLDNNVSQSFRSNATSPDPAAWHAERFEQCSFCGCSPYYRPEPSNASICSGGGYTDSFTSATCSPAAGCLHPPAPTLSVPLRQLMNAPCVHHEALIGHIRYLPMESCLSRNLPSAGADRTMKHLRLFVGQVRLEITASQLAGICHVLAGVTLIAAEPRGPGCFFAYVKKKADLSRVGKLHNAILFDNNGIWYAETADERRLLQEYTNGNRTNMKDAHLPRTTMVVRR